MKRLRADVYSAWRDWQNLPLYSRHLKQVEDLGNARTRWTTEGPQGDLVWEAQTMEDVQNQRIAWRSVGAAVPENAGQIEFSDAPGDRGTEVFVQIIYSQPGGIFGDLAVKATGTSPEAQLAETLRRFKAILECGEPPVVEGQPSNQMRKESIPGDPSKMVGLR